MKFATALALSSALAGPAAVAALPAPPPPPVDPLQGLGPAIQAIGWDAMQQLISGGDLSSAYTAGTLTADKIGEFTKKLPPTLLKQSATGFVQNVFNRGYGKLGASMKNITSTLPAKQMLSPRQAADVPNSKTVKIRYGPYLVPAMPPAPKPGQKKVKHTMEDGTLWNYPDTNVVKPCETCVIVGMNAGLEDKDGNDLNVNKGAWLHHFVLFNQGPGRVDATCVGKQSVPHFAVGTDPDHSERMFSSGNERTPAFMAKWAGMAGTELKPVGYHMKNVDSMHLVVDLMNDNPVDQAYWLTITFDYVDGADGHDLSKFDDMRPIWFDADPCGISEVAPKAQTGSYDITMPAPWKSTVEGEILGYAGHLHDGGQWIDLVADGKPVCKSEATYGATPAYKSDMTLMDEGGLQGAMVHISNMTICQGGRLPEESRYMKKGQEWSLTGHYNYAKDAGMMEDGAQAPVMGIAIMYVRQPYKK